MAELVQTSFRSDPSLSALVSLNGYSVGNSPGGISLNKLYVRELVFSMILIKQLNTTSNSPIISGEAVEGLGLRQRHECPGHLT